MSTLTYDFDIAMARYSLVNPATGKTIVSTDKVSFCLRDNKRVAGATLGSADLARTAEHLRRSGIGFERSPAGLRVPPAEACGAFLPGCHWCPWDSQLTREVTP